MNFWKMNGAGNDFIILDGIREQITEARAPGLARLLCERHLSLGADGLMLVLPSGRPDTDYRMKFYNSDGSEGEMCGNGARCICRYGYETGLAGERQRVETVSGTVCGERKDARRYRVRLNDITLRRPEELLEAAGERLAVTYVEMGTPGLPHAVLALPEQYEGAVHRLLCASSDSCGEGAARETAGEAFRRKASDSRKGEEPACSFEAETEAASPGRDRQLLDSLRELGRELRHHPSFPKGANVNFIRLTGRNEAELITFERGVEDFTYACGTGTGCCAAVLASRGLADSAGIRILNRGGLIEAEVNGSEVFITGPTNIVAVGEIRDEELFV